MKRALRLVMAICLAALFAWWTSSGLLGGDYSYGNNYSVNLVAPPGEGAAGDQFGFSVAQTEDFVIVGAPFRDVDGKEDAGWVFIYEVIEDEFLLQTMNLVTGDLLAAGNLGHAVALYGDYAFVGAPHFVGYDTCCAVFVLKRDEVTGEWNQSQRITYPYPAPYHAFPFFGCSVSLGAQFAAIGAELDIESGSSSGTVYAYSLDSEGHWQFLDTLNPYDGSDAQRFGFSVSLSRDSILVGSPADSVSGMKTGSAYLFYRIGPEWIPHSVKLAAGDGQHEDMFGYSVSLDGERMAVGAPFNDEKGTDAGAVYLYDWDGFQWVETKLTADNADSYDNFGVSVSLLGDRLAVGAHNDDNSCGGSAGSVYIFEHDGESWSQVNLRYPNCVNQDNYFGASVSIGDCWWRTVVGVPGDLNDYGSSAGAAQVFYYPYSDARYFVHLADMHVGSMDENRWKSVLRNILNHEPPPEFVAVAGDLVTHGRSYLGWDLKLHNHYEKINGWTDHLDIDENYNIDYLVETGRSIPIFFCPGNHDYRQYGLQAGPPYSIYNYTHEINGNTYYHELIGEYAIFSLDSGHDEEHVEGRWKWPEGSGLSSTQFGYLDDDLDALDGVDNEADTSSYIKVVMMHHPHENPEGESAEDGEFLYHNGEFPDDICRKYDVDFMLYGHLHERIVFDPDGNSWESGETKCVVPRAMKDGQYMTVGLKDGSVEEVSVYTVLDVLFQGDVDAYVVDQDTNRTGWTIEGADTIEVLEVPMSLYERFGFDYSAIGVFEILTEISVLRADSLHYAFYAEALSNDMMWVEVDASYDDGSEAEFRFENVPIYHSPGASPEGSIVTLHAPASSPYYYLRIIDPGGTYREVAASITSDVEKGETPPAFVLYQNYPNPFNPATVIRYDLPHDCRVRLEIYNVLGQRVKILIDDFQKAGRRIVTWNGAGESGSPLASGVYFCRLEAGSLVESSKMVLLR